MTGTERIAVVVLACAALAAAVWLPRTALREDLRQQWLRCLAPRAAPSPCSAEELRLARLEAGTRLDGIALEREIRMGQYRVAWEKRWAAQYYARHTPPHVLRFSRLGSVG